MTKNILVTGGAGFIGSHLVEALLKDTDNEVCVLDNYSTGLLSNHFDGAKYFKGETSDISSIIKTRPDIIYHLGEYARVEQSFDDLPAVFKSNQSGTFAVLEFARKHRSKFIYAGSSTKFADGGLGRDQSPYAWSKASNTELVRNYGDWFSLPYAIVYFYNVFGPREIALGNYSTVIARFQELYKNNKPLTVVSPGTQRRNFTHVADIVEGLLLVGMRGEGDDYGLGNHESFSIKEVAELFESPIEYLPERKGNRLDANIDTTRARNEFGWQAKRSLRAYIEEFLALHGRKT